MDSFTQIVLGAATGEVVLGKKVGNKAMFWGAVGGTIPDLDILGKFFLSPIDNISFHRGISHSISFSIVGGMLFGWLVYQFYNRKKGNDPTKPPEATLRNWQWLFFWSIFTHPILDCFTMYGTQLFAPFSNIRIAWATISVVDPIYTIPFLTCLIIAAFHNRSSKQRRLWNYLGISLGLCYLSFTAFNKQKANQAFSKAFSQQDIPVSRYLTNPSMFNNMLWHCTAETEDHFYVGLYSLFDQVPVHFTRVEKNHQLLKNINSDPTVQALRDFSLGYFSVLPLGQNLRFNDLRFGTFYGKADHPDDPLYRFTLVHREDLGYYLEKTIGGPAKGKEEEVFGFIWERMWGIKNRQ